MFRQTRQRILDALQSLAQAAQDQHTQRQIETLIQEFDSLVSISVGDISSSTGIAIGGNIQQILT